MPSEEVYYEIYNDIMKKLCFMIVTELIDLKNQFILFALGAILLRPQTNVCSLFIKSRSIFP